MEYKTTQREIKRLIKAGAAIELTDTKTVPAGRLQTVAMSFGIYGMNGGLFRNAERRPGRRPHGLCLPNAHFWEYRISWH